MDWKDRVPDGYVLADQGLVHLRDVKEDQPLRPPSPEGVEICKQWFAECVNPTTRTHKADHSSYGWKHIVEKWAGHYVSNGAFIQAALELDCKFEHPAIPGRYSAGPNVRITLALHEDDWKRVHPTGFSRWLFQRRSDDTPIGDLARDAVADPDWNRRLTKLSELRSRSWYYNLRDVVLQAWCEYRRERAAKKG